ncbi:hypothetical protein [Aquimarina litoralis]|uniref:hypothetical protein n=1 Tax=Aquimarina litoralis TaxID=584605 RepID=UPI001C56ACCE|nr:hypothetical protein [Aquimarina litoralis]MBW1297124.1 hypothetical protein [Aquimarina litoralis]
MRKTLSIILISFLLSVFQSCSIDEQETFEEDLQLIEEINGKNALSGNVGGPIIGGCTIEYTFHDPNLTPAEKDAIRNSYNFFYSYSIDPNTGAEIWIVDCLLFEAYENQNPGSDENGSYESRGCPRGGCPTTPPKDPDPIEDPFNNHQ